MKLVALISAFLALFQVGMVIGQSHVNVITNQTKSMILDKHFIYSEKEIITDIDEVLIKAVLFKQQEKQLINQGIHHKYHWIRIDLENQSEDSLFIFEFNQTNVDTLRLFQVENGRIVKEFSKKGLFFEANNRPAYLSNRYGYVYSISISPGRTTSLYLRADVNDDPFRVMNMLWSANHYDARIREIKTRSSFLLIFSGFVVLICFLSIAMFAFTKQRLYLYYMCFVGVIFLNLLALRSFVSPRIIEEYLFLGNNFSEMFGYIQLFFVFLYTNHFFGLKKTYPRIYRMLKIGAVFTAVLFVMALFLRKYEWFYTFSYVFSKFFMATVSLGLYFFAIYLAFKREIMAYYYVIAYFPLFLFIAHYILTAMKLTDSFNPLEWEYVIFVEIIVLTIAMAHRYYLIMKENSNYQLALIEEQERGIHSMIQAQESERSRISKDLHDGVVQQIGSVILKSRATFDQLNISENKEVNDILEKLEDSNKDLREISHKMMPRTLEELGLVAAISDMLEDSLTPAGIDYTFDNFNMERRLSPEIEINIYRIGQELINNVIKHSKAKKANIQLYQTQEELLIFMVEDNGVGMPEDKKKQGIGLLNINNRTEMLKGEAHFEASPSGGTHVTIKIPIQRVN